MLADAVCVLSLCLFMALSLPLQFSLSLPPSLSFCHSLPRYLCLILQEQGSLRGYDVFFLLEIRKPSLNHTAVVKNSSRRKAAAACLRQNRRIQLQQKATPVGGCQNYDPFLDP